MNSDVLIKVEGVSKKFCKDLRTSLKYGVSDVASEIFGRKHSTKLRDKEFWAVKDVSFELRRGECLGLIGRNGAGKSTLLKMLNGLIKPDSGSIEMHGKVGALIELGAGFNPLLTGRENIYVNGQLLGFNKKEINKKLDAILDFAEIGDFIDSPVQNYSSGMKVRLGFAIAAQMEPDVLLVDEVLAVGDLGFKNKSYNFISKLIEKMTVIFVSHSMSQIAKICNKGLYLKNGKVHTLGNIESTIDSYFEGFNMGKIVSTGTGNAKIISFTLNVNKKLYHFVGESYEKHKIEMENGDDLQFEFEIEVAKPIKNFQINMSFSDSELKNVAQCSAINDDVFFTNYNSKNKIKVLINNVPFGKGIYFLNILVNEKSDIVSRGEILVSYQRFIEFRVSANRVLYGIAPIQFKPTWEQL